MKPFKIQNLHIPSALSMTALLLAGLTLLGLVACASQPDVAQPQVAMHVDAILKFAIEYPRDWLKQSTASRQRREGQVRWTETATETPDMAAELLVSSVWQPEQEPSEAESLLHLQQSYPGFEISHREQVELPCGETRYTLGYTPQRIYSIHTLDNGRREFLIQFSAPTETFASYGEILAGILESFILLEPDETNQTD